ncbi:hypothetical protein [Faecalibacter bovis]|uniref:Lipoprotein n=1 Tax=Faecalibacter bovis TaxID=2898187 RepID=A0ABX7XF63_9FLAO|nr:hypothetical protein [Faecalibacter bovis]QTV06580.1 hypothetical protein J9309_04450 [Faecalibacter bovis]
MKKLVFASFAVTGLLLTSCGNDKKTEVVVEDTVVVDTVTTVVDSTVVDAPVVDSVIAEDSVAPAAPVEAQ